MSLQLNLFAKEDLLNLQTFMQGRSGIMIVGWLASQKGPVQGVADNFEPHPIEKSFQTFSVLDSTY